jgi:hypothetical protein
LGAAFFATTRLIRIALGFGLLRLTAFLTARFAAGRLDFVALLAGLRALALPAALFRATARRRFEGARAAVRFGAAPARRRAGAFRFAIPISLSPPPGAR